MMGEYAWIADSVELAGFSEPTAPDWLDSIEHLVSAVAGYGLLASTLGMIGWLLSMQM